VFMVATIVHIYLNWRPLVSYLKNRASQSFALRAEWLTAVLIYGLITIGTLAEMRPFSSLLAWNEAIKHSWDDSQRRAPVPHAELLTLAELANQVDGVTLESVIENLQAKGVQVESPETVVGDLAMAHNLTPHELYTIAVGETAVGRGHGGGRGSGRGGPGRAQEHSGGRGIGRMSLRQYCTDNRLDLDAAKEKLHKAGLEPSEEKTLREIADTGGIHPSELRVLLE
jgi:hypothetical protein